MEKKYKGAASRGKNKNTRRRCHFSLAATCVCPGVFTWITCGGSLEITTWVCLINRGTRRLDGVKGKPKANRPPNQLASCFTCSLSCPVEFFQDSPPYIAMPGSGCFTEKPRTNVQPSGQLVHNCRVQQNSPPNWQQFPAQTAFRAAASKKTIRVSWMGTFTTRLYSAAGGAGIGTCTGTPTCFTEVMVW